MSSCHIHVFVFLMIRRPPRSTRTDTLFPYTTLFRSFPDAPNNIPELFPNGYSPHLHIYDEDFQTTAGLRGDLSDTFHYDLSSSFSRDWAKYRESSVLNASLGPASPTDMHIGAVTSKEWRSEERRGGKECVRTCRSRGSP